MNAVAWIRMIPVTTSRVLEGLHVYRTRLRGGGGAADHRRR
jgi:hypothetical protein